MSLPEQNQNIGSKWDLLIQEFKKTQQKLSKKNCNNEVKIIQSIYGVKRIQNLITCYLDSLTPSLKKSSQLSLEIRNEGNKIYKRNDQNVNLFESAFLYTLSLKCSENENDLAYAHGNRGAVLMRLGFNKVARNDCEEAIRLNHPDPFKIYERLCALSNGNLKYMRKNVAELEKHMKKGSKQSKEILQKYKTRLKAMEKETFVDDESKKRALEFDKLHLNEVNGEDRVKQMYSETFGRYVVARKAIKKDEPIYIEHPFAFVPVHNYGIKKYFNTDCENCGLVNIWPFLCLECRHSAYCSSHCRDEHFKIHKYECEGYKKNLFFDIGIAHLSLRVLIVGFSSLLKKLDSLFVSEDESIKSMKNSPEKAFEKVLDISSKYFHDYFNDSETADDFQAYARILCLLPNLFRDKSTFSMRNMPYAYTAYMLTVYLKEYTSFLQDSLESTKVKDLLSESEWDILLGALIFRHVGQLVSNGHAIVDFRQNIFTTDALKLMIHKNQPNGGGLHILLKSQRVFTGIFPKISMLNHSCEPNIRNMFEGNRLTIYAAEDIPENGEIFNCYGPHWKLMSYNERQDTLMMQYNFRCKCTYCIQTNDEYRFNNSVLCRICNKRIFYPDKKIQADDSDDEVDESDEDFRLRCDDCNKIHDNVHMKKFFALLAQQSESNFTMNQLYTTYLSAIFGMGSLDEIRYHMTEMMLHTLITNRNVINSQNANIPLTLSIELLNVKESLYGVYSVEYVEAGLFFLDVVSILIDKAIITDEISNPLIEQTLEKFMKSTEICSTNIKCIILCYISRYCYMCLGDS